MSSVEFEWVVGKFSGAQAKSVHAHADAGIGYIVLDHGGRGDGTSVLAAFRRPSDSVIPPYLTEVRDPFKIAEYEKIRKQRQGLR